MTGRFGLPPRKHTNFVRANGVFLAALTVLALLSACFLAPTRGGSANDRPSSGSAMPTGSPSMASVPASPSSSETAAPTDDPSPTPMVEPPAVPTVEPPPVPDGLAPTWPASARGPASRWKCACSLASRWTGLPGRSPAFCVLPSASENAVRRLAAHQSPRARPVGGCCLSLCGLGE